MSALFAAAARAHKQQVSRSPQGFWACGPQGLLLLLQLLLQLLLLQLLLLLLLSCWWTPASALQHQPGRGLAEHAEHAEHWQVAAASGLQVVRLAKLRP